MPASCEVEISLSLVEHDLNWKDIGRFINANKNTIFCLLYFKIH